MKYRKLDAKGDMVFGQGSVSFWKDQPEVVAQAIQTRLNLFLGEWFLDTRDGTPWDTKVLGSGTQAVYGPVILERILNTPGVQTVEAFQTGVDSNTRRLSIAATVQTIYASFKFQASAPVVGTNQPLLDYFILDVDSLS